MIDTKKLIQLSVEKDSNIESPFKNGLERTNHTPYALDITTVELENTAEYGKEINFNIPLNGDLLHRCFLEITLPNLDINTNIIKKNNTDLFNQYNIFKDNKLSNIQNNINFWSDKYENFNKYANIQLRIYVEIKNILKINNFTIDFIKNKILSIVKNYTELNTYLLKIDTNILNETNIIEFITNFTNTTGLSISEIKNIINTEVEKKFNNINNYLSYLYSNRLYHQKDYDKNNDSKIFYKWIENLNHFYFTNFEFYINGISIDTYSNDYLNIYMKHTLTDDYDSLYQKISRNDDSLYDVTDYNKKLYTPLLFHFCNFFDSTKSLPLISLQNSSLLIKSKINNLSDLIYFKNWEELFEENLTVYISRNDHTKNTFNSVEEFQFDNHTFESVDLLIPEYIYKYKFKNINKIILENNFKGIEVDLILETYGIDDNNGNKILNLNEWIYMMNNIKDDPNISETSKIIILDYHYFIDYNYILNLIAKPNVSLLIETAYIDDIEKSMFINSKLEYIVNTKQEIVFDISDNSLFDSLNDISGLIKEMYFIIQPNLHKNGFTQYSKSELNKYKDFKFLEGDVFNNLELSISNEYNLLDFNNYNFNNVVNYLLLNSELPEGVIYKSFGLYHNINQPSGNINLSTTSGQNFLIEINDTLFDNYLSNINNTNNLGFTVKLIYVKYNMLHIEKGIGELLFYN